MGTSSSNSGPQSSSPLIPPWLEELYPDEPAEDTENSTSTLGPPDNIPEPIPNRFKLARTAIGQFASSGSKDDLKRSLGHYATKSLGGADTAAKRLHPVGVVAGRLLDVFEAARSDATQPEWLTIDLKEISEADSTKTIALLVKEICPHDGSQDTEVLQRGVAEALSSLFNEFPDIDLFSLTDNQILFLLEFFVSTEIWLRIDLDLGKNLIAKAPNPATAVRRQNEIRSYIQSEVEILISEEISTNLLLNKTSVASTVSQIIQRVFSIFEDYLE